MMGDKHLARIISDCGIASYSYVYWRRLSPADWAGLMEAAADTGLASILSHFQRVGDNIRQFKLYRKIARGRYVSIYNWFLGQHISSYLGIIPRDILGIVEFYLRARVGIPDDNGFRTSILGIPQSFDGAPSEVREAVTDRAYRWTNNGVLHRDGEPAHITIDVWGEHLECYWYRNGIPRPIHSNIYAMILGDGYLHVRTITEQEWTCPLDEVDVEVLELRTQLWEKYRDFRS